MTLPYNGDYSEAKYVITKEYLNQTDLIVTYTINSYFGLKEGFDKELCELVNRYIKEYDRNKN